MGRYCYICGRTRPNEKFSGKGHAKHECKECQKKKRKQCNNAPQTYETKSEWWDYEMNQSEYWNDMCNDSAFAMYYEVDEMENLAEHAIEAATYQMKLISDNHGNSRFVFEEVVSFDATDYSEFVSGDDDLPF